MTRTKIPRLGKASAEILKFAPYFSSTAWPQKNNKQNAKQIHSFYYLSILFSKPLKLALVDPAPGSLRKLTIVKIHVVWKLK